MTKKSTYSELLRDPRWQKMRLEVLGRDGFSCQKCDDTTSTLHVHHTYYLRGNNPWEYPAESLLTLCDYCHQEESDFSYNSKVSMTTTMSRLGFLWNSFDELQSAFETVLAVEGYRIGLHYPFVSALARLIKTPELRESLLEEYYKSLKIAEGVAHA